MYPSLVLTFSSPFTGSAAACWGNASRDGNSSSPIVNKG